jgi:hypothetical protein
VGTASAEAAPVAIVPLTEAQQAAIIDALQTLFWVELVFVLLLWEMYFRNLAFWPFRKLWALIAKTRFGVAVGRRWDLFFIRMIRKDKKIMSQIRQRWRDKKRGLA